MVSSALLRLKSNSKILQAILISLSLLPLIGIFSLPAGHLIAVFKYYLLHLSEGVCWLLSRSEFYQFVLCFTLYLTLSWKTRTLAINRKDAEIKLIKDQLARDLHDDVGSTLSSIMILSEIAASKIDSDFMLGKAYIAQIKNNASEVCQAMDDIIWEIRNEEKCLKNMVVRMRQFLAMSLESINVSCTILVDPAFQSLHLQPSEKHNILLIYKEAVNNIAKHARATTVEITLKVSGDCLEMNIRDNGRGMRLLPVSIGNGLGNMKARAESIKGILKLESNISKGTLISLWLPLNNNF